MTAFERPISAGDRADGYVFEGPGRCRSCDAPIGWWRTPAGKRAPFDPDGVSHFATCPQAAHWRSRIYDRK